MLVGLQEEQLLGVGLVEQYQLGTVVVVFGHAEERVCLHTHQPDGREDQHEDTNGPELQESKNKN